MILSPLGDIPRGRVPEPILLPLLFLLLLPVILYLSHLPPPHFLSPTLPRLRSPSHPLPSLLLGLGLQPASLKPAFLLAQQKGESTGRLDNGCTLRGPPSQLLQPAGHGERAGKYRGAQAGKMNLGQPEAPRSPPLTPGHYV